MSALLLGVAAVLLAAGAGMIVPGVGARRRVRQELADQRIVFPSADRLPATLASYAGMQVTSGRDAHAFADLIATHVAAATAGRTYSEISEEWVNCRTDERLTRLRTVAFEGQSLRASLLGAYQAWQVATLVIALGALLALIGLGFLALAAR